MGAGGSGIEGKGNRGEKACDLKTFGHECTRIHTNESLTRRHWGNNLGLSVKGKCQRMCWWWITPSYRQTISPWTGSAESSRLIGSNPPSALHSIEDNPSSCNVSPQHPMQGERERGEQNSTLPADGCLNLRVLESIHLPASIFLAEDDKPSGLLARRRYACSFNIKSLHECHRHVRPNPAGRDPGGSPRNSGVNPGTRSNCVAFRSICR